MLLMQLICGAYRSATGDSHVVMAFGVPDEAFRKLQCNPAIFDSVFQHYVANPPRVLRPALLVANLIRSQWAAYRESSDELIASFQSGGWHQVGRLSPGKEARYGHSVFQTPSLRFRRPYGLERQA